MPRIAAFVRPPHSAASACGRQFKRVLRMIKDARVDVDRLESLKEKHVAAQAQGGAEATQPSASA